MKVQMRRMGVQYAAAAGFILAFVSLPDALAQQPGSQPDPQQQVTPGVAVYATQKSPNVETHTTPAGKDQFA